MSERGECIETTEETEYPESTLGISLPGDIPLSVQDKKKERTQRYQNCTEPLDEDLFYELRNQKLLSIDPQFLKKRNNNGTSHSYKNCFLWDIERLSQLPISEENEKSAIIEFLIPSEGATNTQLERVLSSNPNTLVAAMTILTYNYEWCIEELKSKVQKQSFQAINSQYASPNLLFTEKELTSFLLGRTMLIELNKVNKSEYIKELIRSIDGLICTVNQGLIRKIASKRGFTDYYQELIQEGNLGILRALETYDIDRGLRFSTYATSWIRQKQNRFLANNSLIIREPVHIKNSVRKYLQAREKLQGLSAKEPSIYEVYEYCKQEGIKIPPDINLMLEIFRLRGVSSLDEPLNDDENSTLMDIIPEKGDTLEDIVFNQTVDQIFLNAYLNPREITILKLKWGFIQNETFDKAEHTLEEIGQVLGITRERVRQIEKIALGKLRNYAEKW